MSTDIPRVHEILASSEIARGSSYFKPKYLTRGTLVHSACAIVGRGGTIDPLWWERSSGNIGTVGTPFDDYVPHIETRPYVEAYQRWQAQSRWKPVYFEKPLVNDRALSYRTHPDQIGQFEDSPDQWWTIELKCGTFEKWHRLQVALERAALWAQEKIMSRGAALYLPAGKLDVDNFKDPNDLGKAYVMVDHRYLIKEFQ